MLLLLLYASRYTDRHPVFDCADPQGPTCAGSDRDAIPPGYMRMPDGMFDGMFDGKMDRLINGVFDGVSD